MKKLALEALEQNPNLEIVFVTPDKNTFPSQSAAVNHCVSNGKDVDKIKSFNRDGEGSKVDLKSKEDYDSQMAELHKGQETLATEKETLKAEQEQLKLEKEEFLKTTKKAAGLEYAIAEEREKLEADKAQLKTDQDAFAKAQADAKKTDK